MSLRPPCLYLHSVSFRPDFTPFRFPLHFALRGFFCPFYCFSIFLLLSFLLFFRLLIAFCPFLLLFCLSYGFRSLRQERPFFTYKNYKKYFSSPTPSPHLSPLFLPHPCPLRPLRVLLFRRFPLPCFLRLPHYPSSPRRHPPSCSPSCLRPLPYP